MILQKYLIHTIKHGEEFIMFWGWISDLCKDYGEVPGDCKCKSVCFNQKTIIQLWLGFPAGQWFKTCIHTKMVHWPQHQAFDIPVIPVWPKTQWKPMGELERRVQKGEPGPILYWVDVSDSLFNASYKSSFIGDSVLFVWFQSEDAHCNTCQLLWHEKKNHTVSQSATWPF